LCFLGQENGDLKCLKVTDTITTTVTSEQYIKGTKGGRRGLWRESGVERMNRNRNKIQNIKITIQNT
jgi:hypothetical protein